MNDTAIIIVCDGADGNTETAASQEAGLTVVTGGPIDTLIVAATGLKTTSQDGTAIEPLVKLLKPLREGIARLRDGGRIVIICDDVYRPEPNDVGASAIRGGLIGLCRALAIELRNRSIITNLLSTDPLATDGKVSAIAANLKALSTSGLTQSGQIISLTGAKGVGYAQF
jgi:hypothetical protein